MNVLVDTCVWSTVLRYKKPDPGLTEILKELVAEGRIAIIGPIRQEILSGISDSRQFEKLNKKLLPFEDIPLTTDIFIQAAKFNNICRKKGIQGSAIDFQICAIAHTNDLAIFTIDQDFKNFEKHLPIKLLK